MDDDAQIQLVLWICGMNMMNIYVWKRDISNQ